jgi:hypothetical protein
VLLGLEEMSMHALVFQRPDESLDHPVLFRSVRRDELLTWPLAVDQFGFNCDW